MAFTQTLRSSIDPRWSLTVKDSLVHGPFSDFAFMYAKRVVADDQIHRAARRIVDMGAAQRSLQTELATANQKATSWHVQYNELEVRTAELQDNLIACNDKKNRLRGFATIGKFVVYGSAATLVFVGVNQVFHLQLL